MALDNRREEEVLNLLEQLHRHVSPEGRPIYQRLERGFAEFTTEISALKMVAYDPGAVDQYCQLGLTPKEGRILDVLKRAGNRGVSRDGLMAAVYGAEAGDWPQDKIIDVFLVRIRRKIADQPFHIENVFGRGFRFRDGPRTVTRPQRRSLGRED